MADLVTETTKTIAREGDPKARATVTLKWIARPNTPSTLPHIVWIGL